ncbi:hypothetical protein DIPPA_12997 [Diplonema papillatum]|nr:hypothetical protein DIPPA_12997 [Diplonema papillatum]
MDGSFRSSKKLSEVKSIYGQRLPAIKGKDEMAETVSTLSGTSGRSKCRLSYGEEVHPETTSTQIRRQHMERKQQEELDAEARQRREALRRRKRLHDLPSRDFSAGTALMASPAAESPNAHALLAEIERYEKKLQNCHAELRHRQIEYLYVLNGGEPLDDTVYEDFDSDEEREYADEQLLDTFLQTADSEPIHISDNCLDDM